MINTEKAGGTIRPPDGIRIVAAEHIVAAPFGTMLLADMGAEVIMEAARALVAGNVPAAPIHNVTDLAQDAHVRSHNMLVEIEHAAGKVKMVGNPIKLSRVDETYQSPPTLGQHTTEVLEHVLGLSARDVAELREAGIV